MAVAGRRGDPADGDIGGKGNYGGDSRFSATNRPVEPAPTNARRRECPLNADPAVQWRLLDIQALDIKADQLTHRRGGLPETAEAERQSAERAEVEAAAVAVETEISDLGREQRKADADVEQVRTRKTRNQERLDRGQVSSPKELESLQHEIESLIKRQSDLEDAELEVMERLEEAQGRKTELAARRTELESTLAEADRARDAAYAKIDAELEGIRTERARLASNIPDDLTTLYEKLRGQFGGVGAAALRHGRCEGCHIELDAMELARIISAPVEVVQRCENCRRILIRTTD